MSNGTKTLSHISSYWLIHVDFQFYVNKSIEIMIAQGRISYKKSTSKLTDISRCYIWINCSQKAIRPFSIIFPCSTLAPFQVFMMAKTFLPTFLEVNKVKPSPQGWQKWIVWKCHRLYHPVCPPVVGNDGVLLCVFCFQMIYPMPFKCHNDPSVGKPKIDIYIYIWWQWFLSIPTPLKCCRCTVFTNKGTMSWSSKLCRWRSMCVCV